MNAATNPQPEPENENGRLRRRIAELERELAARENAGDQCGEALRESEARYRSLLDLAPDAVLVHQDGRFVYCNAAALRLYGAGSPDQLLGREWIDVVHPDQRDLVSKRIGRVASGEKTPLREFRHLRLDGREIPVETTGAPVQWRGRVAVQVLVRDITERKQAEEAVREREAAIRHSQRQLQDIIDGSPAIVFVKDLEGRFIAINRVLERLLGTTREQLVGKTDYDLFPRERADYYREHDRRVLESGAAEQMEEMATLADGKERLFLANKFPLRDAAGRIYAVCGISTDITDRKRAEERLRQAQKMESLGILAGGVAHDFNNLLVGVIGNASMAREMLPPGDPAAALLERVIATGEQAAHLTRQMLAYSGKGRFMLEPLDLSRLVADISGLVQPSIPKTTSLRLQLAPDLPAVEADRGQLQQVFMNLVLNAAEAIGGAGGPITVETGVEDAADPDAYDTVGGPELRPGRYVYLRVRDGGCGMDEATKAKIFDPFFSTKFTGRGLGLAAVAGIVRGHNGAIRVTTAPGEGTCFTALFPAALALG